MNQMKEEMNTLQETITQSDAAQPLGYIVWWNVRNVQITQSEFAEMLRDCGLSEKYAHTHNYRSAFIRALRQMEEKRIIRKVEETPSRLIYQFTAEIKIGAMDEDELPYYEYSQETQVTIDKHKYFSTGDFAQAVTCSELIKNNIIETFHREKVTYNSSDITRYLKRILKDTADIVALRAQGSVHFVPARFISTMWAVAKLLDGISCDFSYIPIVNADTSRNIVRNAFTTSIMDHLNSINESIRELRGNAASSKWVDNRLLTLKKINKRVMLYSNIVGEEKSAKLLGMILTIQNKLRRVECSDS